MTFSEAERTECLRLLRIGLEEDLSAAGDITSKAVVPSEAQATANLVARQEGIIAGLPALPLLAELYGQGLRVKVLRLDGPTAAGDAAAVFQGPARSLLAVERLALNLLGRLSGVATLTHGFVQKVRGTKAQICDTRKTTPGMRYLEKYAVRVGGGVNHRIGLFDGVLIKDNHLAALATVDPDPITAAVARARAAVGSSACVEIEVDSLTQLESALRAQPDIVLLDNMEPEMLGIAVETRDMVAPEVKLEASGGVCLEMVAEIAATGVDRISIGALTHSAAALDLALDFELSR